MFFIFGTEAREKQLDFEQNILCPHCGRYGRLTVYVRYTCFTLFFIPIFSWGRRYFAKTSCCSSVCELDPQLGRELERRKLSSIDVSALNFAGPACARRCAYCGYETAEDFAYCPKCGRPFRS